MIELLLDSSCVIELTAVEEKALIEVMTCAVKKAAAGGVKGKGKVGYHSLSSSYLSFSSGCVS